MLSEVEVWNLMTRDLCLGTEQLERAGIAAEVPSGQGDAAHQFQIFEAVTAVVFSKLRPDYSWSVTPRSKDDGIDFIGRTEFLKSKPLEIDAEIVIGGQCKKRNRAAKLVDELAGSLITMGRRLKPTFFIAVVSAELSEQRISAARRDLEAELHRHCHIFDRRRIESLIGNHLDAVAPVLRAGLANGQSEEILSYFSRRRTAPVAWLRVADGPGSIPAGTPFRLTVDIRHGGADTEAWRIRWQASGMRPPPILLSPVGADAGTGAAITLGLDPVNPFQDRVELEFVSYATGLVEFGSVELLPPSAPGVQAPLPSVRMISNLRPRFFGTPYEVQLRMIEDAVAAVQSGVPGVLAVVGNGGSGKTRLCQEAASEARRRGADYVTAEQVASSDRPYRFLAELLLALAGSSLSTAGPAEVVYEAVARLQPTLAESAKPYIEALIESAGKAALADNQPLLSCFVLLAAARSRTRPLLVHIQNMHWCTIDALEFVERIVWQADQAANGDGVNAPSNRIRTLFVLEGRIQERQGTLGQHWSTHGFEALLDRLNCRRVRCQPFNEVESAAFITRLFEGSWTAERQLPDAFRDAQAELIENLRRASGGNPFHVLEQLRLLKQRGVIALSPATGLAYLTSPSIGDLEFAPDVLETIRARWSYLELSDPDLARLVAAAALFEDRLPAGLFEALRQILAPSASRIQLEQLELFRFPRGIQAGEISFRHENYFRALRGVTLPEGDRAKALAAYLSWLVDNRSSDPDRLFLEARVRLATTSADTAQIEELLKTVAEFALAQGKPALAGAATKALLDEIVWPSTETGMQPAALIARACRDEVALGAFLIGSGRRGTAEQRIADALERLHRYLEGRALVDPEIQIARIALSAMAARVKFNNGESVQAADISARLLRELDRMTHSAESVVDQSVLLEVLHVHAVASALAGDLETARIASTRAASLALQVAAKEPRAVDVISTHGNIMSAFDPTTALRILLDCAAMPELAKAGQHTLMRLNINTALVRIVLAHQAKHDPSLADPALEAAEHALKDVFLRASATARFATAAAAGLLRGLVEVLRGSDGCQWFAESVTAASRAWQLETLWRAHVNLAHSLDLAGLSPADSAAAAISLLEKSLNGISEEGRSARFRLVAAPFAAAARYCIIAGDSRGVTVLDRIPELRALFADPAKGVLRDDRGGYHSHEWLRVQDRDFVLY